jgi:mediator of RNA polymerase II transcription subunit 17
MNTAANSFPISLRSWPSSKNPEATSLSTLFQRINAERGGIQGLTEESLRQEIAAEKDDTKMDEDGMSEDEAEDDEQPDKLKELMEAKGELMGHLEYFPKSHGNGEN